MSDHGRNLCDAYLREEYADFSHDCVHESMAKNEVWLKRYKINDWPRWDYSMEEATLTFSADGKKKVICDMQVVGGTQGDSWEWAWGNTSLPAECSVRMHEVKAFGQEKQWSKLTTLFLTNDEHLGWECASVASHVLNGIGAYRCRSGGTDDFVYVVVLTARFVM